MPIADQILQRTAHRPWAVPRRPWLWSQGWHNLLFVHWAVPVAALRCHVPPCLEIDTNGGAAWVTAVAFRMARVRPRWLPPLSPVSDFLELNLRTYVRLGDRPGVFFLSIHANKWLAVQAARRFSPLPYAYARMECSRGESGYQFRCRTAGAEGEPAFAANYTPGSEAFMASPASLDEWLLERYCLYVGDKRGRLGRTEVHHDKWAFQNVSLAVERNTLGRPLGLDLSPAPNRTHFSSGVKALAWSLDSVANQDRTRLLLPTPSFPCDCGSL